MNEFLGFYPTWYSAWLGSGWVLGIIACIHVLASHTSVGAALVSTWLATVAVKQNRPELLEYVRRYGVFLLIFSYVLGSITGPGIWFAATVASPRGLSALIHAYVFYWSTEWVFFVTEVVGIYVLVYLAGKIDARSYLTVAWIFGLASWATLLVIAGILSFMLAPGQPRWFSEGGSLAGFYGAYTFVQVFTRTCFMLMSAALAGGLIAARIEDADFRRSMTRTLSKLGIPAAILGTVLFQVGLETIPDSASLMLKSRLPSYVLPAMWSILAILLIYFIALWIRPALLNSSLAAGMLVAFLIFGIWPGEAAREAMRKPWVAAQSVYGNQTYGRDLPALGVHSELPFLEQNGFLASNPWTPEPLRHITAANQLEAGHALALVACSNCHSLSTTGVRPLSKMFADNRDANAIEAFIKGGLVTCNLIAMPCIPLAADEVRALSLFIAGLPLWRSINP